MLVTESCIALLLTLHCESYALEQTKSTVPDEPPAKVEGRADLAKGESKTDEKVCYQHIKCFSRHGRLALPSQFPSDTKFFPPRFLLYDRTTRYFPKTLWLRRNYSFRPLHQFAKRKPLFIVVHGWLESAFVFWAQVMKDALLKQADCNVLLVDWSGLAAATYYNAAANTAAVGRELALVMQRLFTMFPDTLSPTLVHAIGYSFGAQVSGFFGRNLRKKTGTLIARITGQHRRYLKQHCPGPCWAALQQHRCERQFGGCGLRGRYPFEWGIPEPAMATRAVSTRGPRGFLRERR